MSNSNINKSKEASKTKDGEKGEEKDKTDLKWVLTLHFFVSLFIIGLPVPIAVLDKFEALAMDRTW